MPERRRRFSPQFRAEAVQLVVETGKPIADVARDLDVNDGTLGNWVTRHFPRPPAWTSRPTCGRGRRQSRSDWARSTPIRGTRTVDYAWHGVDEARLDCHLVELKTRRTRAGASRWPKQASHRRDL
jgi:transposase-like protein